MSEPESHHPSLPSPAPSSSGTAHTAVEKVNPDVLVDLLGGAKDAGDPAKRDYGERYRYLDVLGEGGQAVVVRAHDNLLEREVAIKALKQPMDPDRELYLEREARICGILEHPNIIPTYDLCLDETGSPFFVMKKIEGQTLDDLLRDARQQHSARVEAGQGRTDVRVSLRHLIDIFLQVCHAVDYAHSRGVFHLDLKPSNVYVGQFGEVYVFDWGFAARKDERQKYIAGTPIYIAPERLRGQTPDARSDIYSLGVILYRILAREYPRNVGKMGFREYRETFESLPVIPPRQRDPSLPRDLEAIVMKALADDPRDRYGCVRDFTDDIDRFLDLLPVTAYQEGVLGRCWKFLVRHRRITLPAAAVFAAVLVASGMYWRSYVTELRNQQYEQRLRARARARLPLEKAMNLVDQLRARVEAAPPGEKAKILRPALDLFDKAVSLNPGDAEAFYQRGRAYILGAAHEKALLDLQNAYRLDGSYIMAHYYAGKILADNLRRPDEATREFELMKQVDPLNEYSELGQARLDLGMLRYDEALARCDRIEATNPAISDVWYIRGLVYQKSPQHLDHRKALAAYDEYIARRRDNPSAFANRGDVRLHLADYEGAVEDYKTALAVQPDYRWALNNLSWVLYRYLDRPHEGLEYAEKAMARDNTDLWPYLNRAAIFEYLKRPDDAEGDYRRAVALAPRMAAVHYRLGVFLLRQERLDEADEALSRAVDPPFGRRDGVWLHRRGATRLVLGAYPDAVRDFEESLRLRENDKIYPALMRWIAMRLEGGPPIDRSQFERQLVHPADKPWLAALGSFYLGDVRRSEVTALATDPESSCEVYFYLGAYDLSQENPASAALMFRRCVQAGNHLATEYTLAWILLRQIEGQRQSNIPADNTSKGAATQPEIR